MSCPNWYCSLIIVCKKGWSDNVNSKSNESELEGWVETGVMSNNGYNAFGADFMVERIVW